MSQLIDGKKISAQVKEAVKQEVATLKQQGIPVGLAVVLVGDDPASKVYVGSKKRTCEELGIHSEEYLLPASTTEEELLELVKKLNQSTTVNGILVQLPLPKQINEETILNAIDPIKDVDAFHPYNVGKIMIGDFDFLPCTPAGIMDLIASTGVDLTGKQCVVIGRSNIVGKPMAMLMLHQNGTVTICHSKTQNLKEITSKADVLIAAVGKANFVTADMVKPGAVVIDVGMNRLENGKLCGDVKYDEVQEVAGYLTPVPGGVGPMTIATLMRNTVTAAKLQHKRNQK
ncbi:bifunctional methylenetetrahydrofolate dehydrogenase/methenyltetrahydrofolate cyclohydrolase FolD [Massilioclostridium coli]|uniref:bifunctional methylenetetrahydrofolate dehydrogenase/methenyltetrahydrofolate cyclohydrolase FolD n=1 Tax=Massilioclostridium coli TaxID=1870991 RepID=UPI00085BBFF9|nr:bifunctional methylenetetrahydrofolate dehydrogenase/methenyltetrahydrofolate cyclohydrolase FolD [Massilioclostridium coli]